MMNFSGVTNEFFMQFSPLTVCFAAMGDLFDPFGMGTGSAVGSGVGSSRPASGPDLFGDLLGSDSSGTSGFSSAHTNTTPASKKSLFDLSNYISSCDIIQHNIHSSIHIFLLDVTKEI